ncbi:aryl-alcohol dehydrogenase-like predicted oxidoreductase [Krasilnikovia cinnamomea]|uniref:Aryl-alcohol dehydrogenase-like predicted oxidoreductase n=1 Tax=Krasilnikovia cinnamomea TaxID=349313 RepID=A0A4Q7ZN01_9ACTN|nr:aldo/keto reductase [Krasilnikovia cinnamomea]RZU52398.1 aryl-alcohol dehydrogenase-like predicted oxidoreductase [Krasilnikovia cinnamomea]
MAEIVLGAMLFGTRIGEADSFALLDRFVQRGGRWIDTANNYAFWLHPSGFGGQSEQVIGRWLAARPGMRARILLSTKAGAQPTDATRGLDAPEGLTRAAVGAAMGASLRRLGVDHVDMYWAHIEDRSVELADTVSVFAELAAAGKVRRLGASNTPAWRVERARGLAAARDVPGWTAMQLRYSYVQPRPGAALEATSHRMVFPETLDYVRADPELELWAYSTLLNGGYSRADRPLEQAYDHPGTTRRLAALAEVARDLGVTRNQVVLAWLLGGDPPVFPIVGASTLDRLDEVMDAAALTLDPELRARLDAAR